mmetsp:Transcript_32081/g.92050  ORF Transcript_32081/g.92050 Transcript_32081/m.92050 type:complete len:394 (+) Transcript_32081:404-1585(+)
MLGGGPTAEVLALGRWRPRALLAVHRHEGFLLHEPVGGSTLLARQGAGGLVADGLPGVLLATAADRLLALAVPHLVDEFLVAFPLLPRPVHPRRPAPLPIPRPRPRPAASLGEDHLAQVHVLLAAIVEAHPDLGPRGHVLLELNHRAVDPLAPDIRLDLDARVTKAVDDLLVGLHPLPVLAQRRQPLLHVPLRDHRQARKDRVVVPILTQQALHILADRGPPLGVGRRPQLLVIKDVLSEPAKHLVVGQAETHVEEAGTTEVRALLRLDDPPQLAAVEAHGKEAVEAAEKGRGERAAVRHIGLDAVGKLVRLVDQLLEGLQCQKRLEVSALDDVRLQEPAEAEGLLVRQLQRPAAPVHLAALGDGPVRLPAVAPAVPAAVVGPVATPLLRVLD